MNSIEKLAALNCEISEMKNNKYPDAGITISGKKYNLLAIKLPYGNIKHAIIPSYPFNPNPQILGFSIKEIYANYYNFDKNQCKELDKMGIKKYIDVDDKLDDLLRCAKYHKNWAQAVKEAVEDVDRRKILLLYDLMKAIDERNGIAKYGDDDENDKKEIAEDNIKIKCIKKYISDSNFVEHPLDDSFVKSLEKEIG